MNYKWYQQVLGQYKAILSGTWWYWVSKNWHCLDQAVLGITWYRVSIGLVCLYIFEKVEIWSGVTDASHTHSQTTEYIATQLFQSIKFKLSHANRSILLVKFVVFKNQFFVSRTHPPLLHFISPAMNNLTLFFRH